MLKLRQRSHSPDCERADNISHCDARAALLGAHRYQQPESSGSDHECAAMAELVDAQR